MKESINESYINCILILNVSIFLCKDRLVVCANQSTEQNGSKMEFLWSFVTIRNGLFGNLGIDNIH